MGRCSGPIWSGRGSTRSGGPTQLHGLVWKFKTGGPVHSSPVISGGVAYVGSWDGYLYAVDIQSGQEKWKFKTGTDLAKALPDAWTLSSPAISDGMVYFGSWDGYLYALDSTTGQEKWKFKTAQYSVSSPAISDGVVYFGSFDDYLHAVDSATGKEK